MNSFDKLTLVSCEEQLKIMYEFMRSIKILENEDLIFTRMHLLLSRVRSNDNLQEQV